MQGGADSRRLWRGIRAGQLFGPEECRALVSLADAQEGWREAVVSRGGGVRVRSRRRRARQLSIAGGSADASLRGRFDAWLEPIERWMRELDRRHFRLGIRGIRDAQLVAYERGGFYDWHPDARDPEFRKLTALCYLTDRESDGVLGGETRFAPDPLGRWMRRPGVRANVRALAWLPTVQTPRRGRVIAFDARIPHCAQRVRRGRKVSLNVWLA